MKIVHYTNVIADVIMANRECCAAPPILGALLETQPALWDLSFMKILKSHFYCCSLSAGFKTRLRINLLS